MKSKDLRSLLVQLAEVIEAAKAAQLAHAISNLSSIFAVFPEKNVSEIIKRLNSVKSPSASFLESKISMVAPVIGSLVSLLRNASKQTVAKDFSELSSLLDRNQDASIDKFVHCAIEALNGVPVGRQRKKKELRGDLVEAYYHQLERALGDDPGFSAVLSRLENDADMGSPEITALAKRFTLETVKSRAPALKKIRARQQALMTSRARSAATAGRIAG